MKLAAPVIVAAFSLLHQPREAPAFRPPDQVVELPGVCAPAPAGDCTVSLWFTLFASGFESGDTAEWAPGGGMHDRRRSCCLERCRSTWYPAGVSAAGTLEEYEAHCRRAAGGGG